MPILVNYPCSFSFKLEVSVYICLHIYWLVILLLAFIRNPVSDYISPLLLVSDLFFIQL